MDYGRIERARVGRALDQNAKERRKDPGHS